jgi:hypothetical protein
MRRGRMFRVVLQVLCVEALLACVVLADDAPLKKLSPNGFAGKKAGQTRADNGLKTPLAWIPPGHFTMGSPKGEKGRDVDKTRSR